MKVDFKIFGLGVLLFGLIACNDAPTEGSAETQPTEDTLAVQATPEAGYREEIIETLKAYYRGLEDEQLDAERFFAPTVERFYTQQNQPRARIAEIIRRGFDDIKARSIELDESSFEITPTDGGYVVIFGGMGETVREGETEVERAAFRNRFVLNEQMQIVEYGAMADAAAASTERASGAMAPESDISAADAVLALADALNNEDLSAANRYIHPDYGLYFVTRPGAIDAIYNVKTLDEVIEYNPWLKDEFARFQCPVTEDELPEFDCEDFSKEGCFLDEVTTYDRISEVMRILTDSELNSYTQAQMRQAKEVEAIIEYAMLQTEERIAMYLGRIDGQWYVLVLDTAQFDCSA